VKLSAYRKDCIRSLFYLTTTRRHFLSAPLPY